MEIPQFVTERQYDIDVYLMALWKAEKLLEKNDDHDKEYHQGLMDHCYRKLTDMGMILPDYKPTHE